MRFVPLRGLAVVAFSLLLVPTRAGTAVRLDLEALAQRAALLVEGRVMSRSATLDTRGRVVTDYGFQVSGTYWGEKAAYRVVRMPGGVLEDGSGMWIPGMPRLAVGENWILALCTPDFTGMCMPVGLAQGAMRVVHLKDGGRRVMSGAPGLHLLGAADGERGGRGHRAETKSVDYAVVRARLTAACENRRVSAQSDGEER